MMHKVIIFMKMICHFKGYIMNDTLFYAIEAMKKIANDELSGNDEVCKYIISALDELGQIYTIIFWR